LIAESRTASLFRRLLGAAFDSLPHPVQLLHEGRAQLIASGRCDVERGSSLLSRLLAALTALPAEGRDVPVTVVIRADAERETWTRAFRGQRMGSTLHARDGLLEEHLGPATFLFRLDAADGAIVWTLEEVRALGVPLPAAWFRGVTSRESADGPRYRFDVRAQLPIAGLLVHYRGTLDVD
jgi:hypothetical protein